VGLASTTWPGISSCATPPATESVRPLPPRERAARGLGVPRARLGLARLGHLFRPREVGPYGRCGGLSFSPQWRLSRNRKQTGTPAVVNSVLPFVPERTPNIRALPPGEPVVAVARRLGVCVFGAVLGRRDRPGAKTLDKCLVSSHAWLPVLDAVPPSVAVRSDL
jgi:hypothetical protein